MNEELIYTIPSQDQPQISIIENQVKLIEQSILVAYSGQKATVKIDEKTIIDEYGAEKKIKIKEVTNRRTLDFIYLKTELEKTPYCLQKFWLSDLFYLCHEIRGHLHENELKIAKQKLEEALSIHQLFLSLSQILRSYSHMEYLGITESVSDILFHFVTPKLYSYCYVSHNTQDHRKDFENFLRANIRNKLTDTHRILFLRQLKKKSRNRKTWRSKRAAILSVKELFHALIRYDAETNKEIIIDGRKTYIKVFSDMRRRAKSLIKDRPWLKDLKLAQKENNNILNVIETLDYLIKEQKDYLSVLKDEDKTFIFLKREEYGDDTLTNWLNDAPYLGKKIIKNKPNKPNKPKK